MTRHPAIYRVSAKKPGHTYWQRRYYVVRGYATSRAEHYERLGYVVVVEKAPLGCFEVVEHASTTWERAQDDGEAWWCR